MKVLLIHVGRAKGAPLINLMAMGLVSIANYLNKQGHGTEILHLGIERLQDASFSLTEAVREKSPLLCGFSLSWHQQTHEVLQHARSIKEVNPTLPIVLGGFTASRYATEILQHQPQIDYVVQGDGEVPLDALVRAIETGVGTEHVPNLFWRDDTGAVRANRARYQLQEEEVRDLDFVNFEALRYGDRYLKLRMNSAPHDAPDVFYFSPGRGCSAACLYCAGNRAAQRRYNRRDRVILFPVDYVADQLEKLVANGTFHWNVCFDPYPEGDYYLELFRELRRRALALRVYFDCFGLPTRSFTTSFAQTFLPGSSLNISPETGSEPLRRRLRSFAYSNDDLVASIKHIQENDLACSVYFSTGLPLETNKDFELTVQLLTSLRDLFPDIEIYVGEIDIEPGAPSYEHPAAVGIINSPRSFLELLRGHRDPLPLHYETCHFSKTDIEQNISALRSLTQKKKAGVHE